MSAEMTRDEAIAIYQNQDASHLGRLNARAHVINLKHGTNLRFSEANLWINHVKQTGFYSYMYLNVGGGASDFRTSWQWLNGVEAGFEMAAKNEPA